MLQRESSLGVVLGATVLLVTPDTSLAQDALPSRFDAPPDASAAPPLSEPDAASQDTPPEYGSVQTDSRVAMTPASAAQPAPAAPATLATPAAAPAAASPVPASHGQARNGAPGAQATGSGKRPLPFGEAEAAEVGGAMALTHDSETTAFRLTPAIGYFIAKGFELSLMPEMRVMQIDESGGPGADDVSIGIALEASYHAPMAKEAFVFGGIGIGARYAKDPEYSTFLRTRFGLDVLLGRSGTFKPAAFLDMGFDHGVTAGGLEAGFMLAI